MTNAASLLRGAVAGLRDAVSTLKFRVVLVVVGSALVAGLVSTYFVSGQSGKVATRLLLEQQTAEIELVAEMHNSQAAQVQYALRLLASQITPELLRNPAALQELLVNRVLIRQTFAALIVAAPDSQVLASWFGEPAPSLPGAVSQAPEFRRTLSSAAAQIGDPFPDYNAGRAAVMFTMGGGFVWPGVPA